MYVLEISRNYRGSWKYEFYVYPEIELIWKSLKEHLVYNPYIWLFYGVRIILYEVGGNDKKIMDLFPYITVTWKGQRYRVNEQGIVGYRFPDEEINALFYTLGKCETSIEDQNIVFHKLPLVIHLSLPPMSDRSPFTVMPWFTDRDDKVGLPTDVGYHSYE